MKIIIADHECTIIWEGIYYFALSNYPYISDWELKKLLSFLAYEKANGRETQIECENKNIMDAVKHAMDNPEMFLSAQKPSKITECTACKQKGCLTDFVCHTASVENAKSILSGGNILSAVKARKLPASVLVEESRNAAGDPEDYFDYMMLAWGNCQAGDRLVIERTLGRGPDENDLSVNFKPGVRFYFKYDDIILHPSYVFDGYHPVKIQNELILSDYLTACIIPATNKTDFEGIVPDNIKDRVFYVKYDCTDIWEWSEKVYSFVTALSAKVTRT